MDLSARQTPAPYTQLYSVQTPALTWAADQSPVAVLGWTLNDAEPAGRLALEVTLRARRECGDAAGALARWQAAHGLKADSIGGARTLAAMGLS